jgi:hypothetical protein
MASVFVIRLRRVMAFLALLTPRSSGVKQAHLGQPGFLSPRDAREGCNRLATYASPPKEPAGGPQMENPGCPDDDLVIAATIPYASRRRTPAVVDPVDPGAAKGVVVQRKFARAKRLEPEASGSRAEE